VPAGALIDGFWPATIVGLLRTEACCQRTIYFHFGTQKYPIGFHVI
jgi:hypothetical protein